MTDHTQVEDMAKAQREAQAPKERRKAMLSPELNEFLHMMKSLESEFSEKQAQPT
jgi:hypothetical protein